MKMAIETDIRGESIMIAMHGHRDDQEVNLMINSVVFTCTMEQVHELSEVLRQFDFATTHESDVNCVIVANEAAQSGLRQLAD